MKAYRVRGDDTVEAGLAWKGMDGTAYVAVGGTNRSYVSVSPKLATPSEREGRVFDVDFKPDGMGGIELVPAGEIADEDGSRGASALVVIPSGGYEFGYLPGQLAVNPRCAIACRTVVLKPGEEIRAFPKVRSFAEAQASRSVVLRFDGKEVTFKAA